ncbi:MAG: alpha/beta hydrolase, partial [Rhodospirillales bacterium]|nr:alpha/beta hydrolase [Rhodospirillales bacterium]
MTRTLEVLDRPEVRGVLFYPRREAVVPQLQRGTFRLSFPVGDAMRVGGKLFVAAPEAPTILYFHGNGEIAADYDTIAPFYTRIGVNLCVVDYRGYGTSDGQPSASALLADAVACWQQLPSVLSEKGLKPASIWVMGRSLGSAAALEIIDTAAKDMTSEIQPAGLIIESGFAYTFALIERIGFVQLADAFESRDGFGNLDKIAGCRLPTLIIHGERDWIIPFSDAEALFEASPAPMKTLLPIPGAGHNDLMMVGQKSYF